jgi:hypothetical protein
MIRLLGDVRIKNGFIIPRRDLEKMPQSVNIAYQYFVHECDLQVLRFDLKLKYLVFKLYFADEFLCVIINCCNLVASKLLLS